MTTGVAATTTPWLNASVIVAYVGLLGTLVAIAANGYLARAARRREQFAEALAVVLEYWEFPYVVRRRRHDQPEHERIRISEAMRDVQRRISFHQTWIRTESRAVAALYDELVVSTRTIIGGQVREAWSAPPITEDGQMNISDVRFDGLHEIQDRYLEAVSNELSLWPTWARRATDAQSS